MSNVYFDAYKKFTKQLSGFETDFLYEHQLEAMFEILKDWSQLHTLNEVETWFSEKRLKSKFEVEELPLNQVNDWHVHPTTGNITHSSGDFFEVCGIRVRSKNREITGGWDQPIIKQIGYDGGILGLIRKRFNGVPHYLCEAKEEPGNYGLLQISPTLQATFANIKKAHGGRAPYFLNYFSDENYEKVKVLFDAWLSEDGGRLYNKRNRAILIEVTENHKLELPNDNFIWLSLYQIKALLKQDAWINPHVRGILAHV